jgi:predicted DNA-binding protein YlxM (UPF0122 family)
MKGISERDLQEKTVQYQQIYSLYSTGDFTLSQIGKTFGITKQRVWQIITRCKLGEGEYYEGTLTAKAAWKDIKESSPTPREAEERFMQWLDSNDVRVISNNRTAAPHTGLKEDAKRSATLETS